MWPAVGDAAGLRVAEVDAGDVAVERPRGLAGERAQDVAELEAGVERAGGADERLVLLGPCLGSALGLDAGEPRGGLVAERAGPGELRLLQLPALAEDRDRDVAHLAGPGDRHEQRGGDLEALDVVRADDGGAGRVDDVQRRAGLDDVLDARGPAVERLDVARSLAAAGAHDVPVAGRGALRDLDEMHLVGRQDLEQGGGQRPEDAFGGVRGGRGARELLEACGSRPRPERVGRGSGGGCVGGERFGNDGTFPRDGGVSVALSAAPHGRLMRVAAHLAAFPLALDECSAGAGVLGAERLELLGLGARRGRRVVARAVLLGGGGAAAAVRGRAGVGRAVGGGRGRLRGGGRVRARVARLAVRGGGGLGGGGGARVAARAGVAGALERARVVRDRHAGGRPGDLVVLDLAAAAADRAEREHGGDQEGGCGTSRAHGKKAGQRGRAPMRRPQVGQSLRSFWAGWSHQLQKRRFSTAHGRFDCEGGSGSSLPTTSSVSPVSRSRYARPGSASRIVSRPVDGARRRYFCRITVRDLSKRTGGGGRDSL